ncbi:MAG TPA: lytic transglycosylase domain-containing protein [Gemmatimonadaceae bacterium]|jgi:soluble lytic murein transglycosylase-like protein|nr:lytic transglycosylase domain-containing protein [Gemmatimonadaceae bacterium]
MTDRRQAPDRREQSGAGRRASKPSRWLSWLTVVGRDALVIVVTLAAIAFSVDHAHPIFANQPTIAAELSKVLPPARIVLPAAQARIAQMMTSPQFAKDRQAFAADLVKTGRMNPARADSVAYYAVRESYANGIPPAVVFGVMLTENAVFASSALSNVGAVGLMQVYPKVWLKALSARFGSDLATDSTNLKYGIYILGQYIKSDSGKVTPRAVSTGLLHYNGCVHGTNTHGCQSYPSKVKGYVEREASSICGDKGFYACIAKPFVAGLLGKAAAGKAAG